MIDDGLLARAQQGDRAAVAQLVSAHVDDLYNACYYLTGRREDAEDLVQEAFAKLLQHLPELRRAAALRAWLRTVATRTYFNQLRRQKRLVRWEAELWEQVPGSAGVEEEVLAGLDGEELARALIALPDHYRLVIHLRHLQDLSYEEMAAELEVPLSTVRTLLFRARKALRRVLGEGGAGGALQ